MYDRNELNELVAAWVTEFVEDRMSGAVLRAGLKAKGINPLNIEDIIDDAAREWVSKKKAESIFSSEARYMKSIDWLDEYLKKG